MSRRFLSARNNLSKLRINERKCGLVFPNVECKLGEFVALSLTSEMSFFKLSRFFCAFSSDMVGV